MGQNGHSKFHELVNLGVGLLVDKENIKLQKTRSKINMLHNKFDD